MIITRVGSWTSSRKVELKQDTMTIDLRLRCTECNAFFAPSKEMRDYALYMGRKPTDICLCQYCLEQRFATPPFDPNNDYEDDELN